MIAGIAVLLFLVASAADAAPGSSSSASRLFSTTLIDVSTNTHVDEWSVSAKEFPTVTNESWSIRKSVLRGGKQNGVDVIVVDNGKLAFTVVPTRGMGLWEGRCGDIRLGWESPVKEIVHPALVSLDARGGLGWLDGFGEWISRCGLESNGAPGVDEVVNNNGNRVSVQLTLHGKVSYLPAREVSVSVDSAPPHTIRVRGVVDEVMMFGPKLRLITEFSTLPNSGQLVIEDKVINLSGDPQEMQLLYHCNFGHPILEEGARVVHAAQEVNPRDARAAEADGVAQHAHLSAPKRGYVEQVYYINLKADERGETEVLLRNRAGNRGASLRFSLRELPYFTLWKNTAAKEDGYVVGLEPATNFPNNRSAERKAGRVVVLPPAGTYHSRLEVNAFTDADGVRASEERIRKITR
jgi:hypothetical protein